MGLFSTILGSKEKEERLNELKKNCSTYAYNRERLKLQAVLLYNNRKKTVNKLLLVPDKLSTITNLPSWCYDELSESLNRIKDFQLAIEYENSPEKFAKETDKTGRTAAYIGAGTATGAAIATLGPTAAMSIATVIGTASTGTAISALSGIAATNAALAWLGGGTLAAGGAGIAGGSLILGLFGPIGWSIAGLSTIGGIITARIKNKNEIKKVEEQIDIIKHDNNNMKSKLIHLSDLISRSNNNFQNRLKLSLEWLDTVHPKNYKEWNDSQKHELEKLINIISNTVQLINERI